MGTKEIAERLKELPLDLPLLISNAFLPTAYKLALSIDHLKPNFKASTTIELSRNPACTTPPSTFQLCLHSHNLVILSAKLTASELSESKKLQVCNRRDSQTVVMTCDTHTEGLSSITIDITYMGSIHNIQTYRDETYGVFKTNYSDSVEGRSDNYIVATHSQPYGARSIFPCVDEVNVRASFSLQITTHAKFKALSNSKLASHSYVDMSDQATFTFETTPPMPTSTFAFVLGDLECLQSKAGEVPVSIATTKGDSHLTQYALHCVVNLLPILEELFGVKYPLPKLDIVTLPFFSEGAMENWGLITVVKESLFVVEDPCITFQTRQLLAHQLTHQWLGNLISFDDFKYMWLTEAFATFVGDFALSIARIEPEDSLNYNIGKSELVENLMDIDCFYGKPIPSLNEHMNSIKTDNSAKTGTIFEKQSYDKGMVILNMVSTMFQLDKKAASIRPFFTAFKAVLEKYQLKAIKPFEIWNTLNASVSFDLPTFMHSWIQYSGYPCLRVTMDGDNLKITQHRFLYDGDAVALGLEDAPFNVPLAIRAKRDDGETIVINQVLCDRSTNIGIKPEQLVSLNFNKQFYYKVVYEPAIMQHLLSKIKDNQMSPLEVMGLINDYGRILGQPFRKDEAEIFGKNQLITLASIIGVLASETWKIDYNVLKIALTFLETINNIMLHFSEYDHFKVWLDAISEQLFQKVGSWDDVIEQTNEVYDSCEYECRNVILQLASESKDAQTVCKRLYKNLIHSGIAKKFVAKELFSATLNVTMTKANMNEYKQILALVKNSNVSYLKHTNGSVQDLQTAAVSSLGFCRQRELLNKTLHFVNTNIDSKMIELALIGFKYQHTNISRELIWAWYKVNYDQWVRRSLRKGSDWSKQIHTTVTNITKMVLGEIMQYKHEEIEKFVKTKALQLPLHGLIEAWEEVEADNEEKRAVARFYNDLVDHL